MMKKIFLVSLMMLLSISAYGYDGDEVVKEEADMMISKLVDLMKDIYATEYKEARNIKLYKHKITGREQEYSVIAIFTIEGYASGNNYTQYMAIFTNLSLSSENKPKRLSFLDVIQVGGKGFRNVTGNISVSESKILDIIITLPILNYGPEDAMCCPSKKSNAYYSITLNRGGRIKEVKRGT